MTEEISDVLLLCVFGVGVLLVLLVWLAGAYGLAVLIGRAIRWANPEEPPVDTREMALIRALPTDTVEMRAVRR